MTNWMTRLRVAIAVAIAPPGTTVVPPLRPSTPPRADIAPTPTVAPRKVIRIEIAGKTPAPPVRLETQLYIFQCRDPLMWYADKVGQFVPHLGTWPNDGYKSIDTGGYVNIVKFSDATVMPLNPL